MRCYRFHARLIHCSFKLRFKLMIVNGIFMINLVSAEFIKVNGDGQAVLIKIFSPETKPGFDAFVSINLGVSYLSGGVVNDKISCAKFDRNESVTAVFGFW